MGDAADDAEEAYWDLSWEERQALRIQNAIEDGLVPTDFGDYIGPARAYMQSLKVETEGTRVTTTNADRKAALRRQLEELAVRVDKLERIPNENPFSEGDVFKLSKNWGGVNEYTYVGIYIAGQFYTSGRRTNTAHFSDWESFSNWAGEQAFTIEKATGWEMVVE